MPLLRQHGESWHGPARSYRAMDFDPFMAGPLAGVCMGLAEQFGVSVTILRLAFVLGFVFSIGTFLLVYVILWIIMPSESEHRADVINGP